MSFDFDDDFGKGRIFGSMLKADSVSEKPWSSLLVSGIQSEMEKKKKLR